MYILEASCSCGYLSKI